MDSQGVRLESIRVDVAARELDALVVAQPENRRYVTGFTGSAGLAVITSRVARLLTDSRYFGQAVQQAPLFTVEQVGYRMVEALTKLLGELGVTRVGFEADTVTVSELGRLREQAPEVDWVATAGLVEAHRAVKSDEEIAAIRRAVALSDAAMDYAYGTAQVGMTEKALAWDIERYMREDGADGMAFEPIVAAGENGALPHHRPGERVIHAGEPVVVDIGARLDGYHSDLTRTFIVGPGPAMDPEFATVYDVVDRANRSATAGLRAGLTGPSVDKLARDVIADAGYGDFFGHGLGHGIGLKVHEAPHVSYAANDAPLVAGMVTSIEPGIYLPGRFGVRIEDLVVIREHAAEVLTRATKQPTAPDI